MLNQMKEPWRRLMTQIKNRRMNRSRIFLLFGGVNGAILLFPILLFAAIDMEHGSIFGVGLRASTIASGDLDGDGDLDLAVANIQSNSISIAYNDGNGNFTNIKVVPLEEGRKYPIAVTIGNLDNYAQLD